MYVEGEVLETPITISDNTFLNNYNESHYIGEDKLNMYGAVIATEIAIWMIKKLVIKTHS